MSLPQLKCQNCSISKLCLPVMLADSEVEHLDNIVQRGTPYKKGEFLYRDGQDFQNLYAIRSGSLKSFTISEQGEEQIIGFHLPGEILGLDGIYSDKHKSFTKAMETSMVCAIPYPRLDELSAQIPALRKQFNKMMSKEISEDQELMLLLNKKNADERVAAFIINLSSRFSNRGMSSKRFRLTMTRSDIGNYLGLAIETVSRIFSKLQVQELIAIKDKEVEIINVESLSNLAGTYCHFA